MRLWFDHIFQCEIFEVKRISFFLLYVFIESVWLKRYRMLKIHGKFQISVISRKLLYQMEGVWKTVPPTWLIFLEYKISPISFSSPYFKCHWKSEFIFASSIQEIFGEVWMFYLFLLHWIFALYRKELTKNLRNLFLTSSRTILYISIILVFQKKLEFL